MKKVLGLVAVLMISAISFGQSAVKFKDATSGYDKSVTTSFNFSFGPEFNKEDIASTAGYYESYFTVEISGVDAGQHLVKITLVEDNEMARRVILRLFVSLEVKQISVNGEKLDRNDFMTKYIWLD